MSQRVRICLALTVVLGLLVGMPAAASANVVIKKIAFDPPGSDTGTNRHINKEIVVLKNRGSRARSFDGWKLHDSGRDHTFNMSGVSVSGGDVIKIHSGRGQHRVLSGCGGACTVHHYYWGLDNYVWNNDGDVATLKNRAGTVVDRCRYGSSATSPKRC